MINRVCLTGRLTKDVDLSYTPQGIAKAQFTLAVNRAFANQSGDREADFINIQVWRKAAENAANYLKKGSLVGIDGKLHSGSYERDGQRIYFTNVVADSVQFLDTKNSTGGSQSTSSYESSTNYHGATQNAPQGQNYGNNNQSSYTRVDDDPFANSKGSIEVSSDDLPF